MNRWKALIVDDETPAREELKRMLAELPDINIRGEAGSMKEAVEAVNALQPDVIFLDIDLGTHTGFDLLERVAPTFRVIFVTAYDAYAIRAFQVNALDYLLKPVHPERLRAAVQRLGNPVSGKAAVRLEPYDRILISNHTASRLISVQTISYIEAMGDYTRVHGRDGFTGTVHQTIKGWMERLPASLFLQTHRSYLVNMDRISKLLKKNRDSYMIVLDRPEAEIPLSRNYSRKFIEIFRPD